MIFCENVKDFIGNIVFRSLKPDILLWFIIGLPARSFPVLSDSSVRYVEKETGNQWRVPRFSFDQLMAERFSRWA